MLNGEFIPTKTQKKSKKNPDCKRFGFETQNTLGGVKNKNLIRFVTVILILLRLYVVITPLFLTMDTFHLTIFLISYCINYLFMIKLIYLAIIYKKQYLAKSSTILDIVFTIGTAVFGSLYWIFELKSDSPNTLEIWEVLWSFSSFGHFFGILVRLGKFRKFAMIYSLFKYSFSLLAGFLFTMIIFFYIMALLGET